MGLSRQAYYQGRQRHAQREERAQTVVQLVRDQRVRQPRLGTRQRLVHHSDRGIQYCSSYYQAIHQRYGLRCSMTDGYDFYQNALAERVNGILKGELLLQRPADLEQARRMVRESVQIYNTERPHLSLKMQTPDAVHRASLADICRSDSPSQAST
jgi:putative transposase